MYHTVTLQAEGTSGLGEMGLVQRMIRPWKSTTYNVVERACDFTQASVPSVVGNLA